MSMLAAGPDTKLLGVIWGVLGMHSWGLAHTRERRELRQQTPRHWALCGGEWGVRDTHGNITFLTDTDLRRGRERVVTLGDKDDNVLQIDNLQHILNLFHGAAVIFAGLFGEQEVKWVTRNLL